MPNQPCTVLFLAQARDPESDALTFSWTGCATSSTDRADCLVRQPGTSTATVAVSDGHGNVVKVTATATGDNKPPELIVNAPPGIIADGEIDIQAVIQDPEEGNLCLAE